MLERKILQFCMQIVSADEVWFGFETKYELCNGSRVNIFALLILSNTDTHTQRKKETLNVGLYQVIMNQFLSEVA